MAGECYLFHAGASLHHQKTECIISSPVLLRTLNKHFTTAVPPVSSCQPGTGPSQSLCFASGSHIFCVSCSSTPTSYPDPEGQKAPRHRCKAAKRADQHKQKVEPAMPEANFSGQDRHRQEQAAAIARERESNL